MSDVFLFYEEEPIAVPMDDTPGAGGSLLVLPTYGGRGPAGDENVILLEADGEVPPGTPSGKIVFRKTT